MAIKRHEAVQLVTKALEKGLILQSQAPNGEAVTAGPNKTAVPVPLELYAGYRYGRSRWAGSLFENRAGWLADWFVENVGRGAARLAVEKAGAR